MGNNLFSCCEPGRSTEHQGYQHYQDSETQTSSDESSCWTLDAGVKNGRPQEEAAPRGKAGSRAVSNGSSSMMCARSGLNHRRAKDQGPTAFGRYTPDPLQTASLSVGVQNGLHPELKSSGSSGRSSNGSANLNAAATGPPTRRLGPNGTSRPGPNTTARAATAGITAAAGITVAVPTTAEYVRRHVCARPAGPRVVHAHPNGRHNHLVPHVAGASGDVRGGGRSGAAYGAAGSVARAGGRFGSVSVVRGTDGGASAVKGLARPAHASTPGAVATKYEMKGLLGEGSTSKCFRCVNRRTRREFACKVIDKRAMDPKLKPLLAQFHVEIQVLQLLRHPNIIHMEDVYESDAKIHMIMEVMNGGELFDYVVEKGTLSESEASVMVRKVTSAVAYMHSLNIIHRDLKPENLLLTSKRPDSEVKIIDFGLAKVMGAEEDCAQSFLGTRGYLAPEMLQRQSYNKEVDVWALGIIVFVLLCGCLPFDDDSSKLNRAGALQKFVLRFPRWAQNLSAGAKSLLSQLLVVTPQARLTAKEALDHPWVTGQMAAADKFLESPRTLRRLRVNSPKRSKNGRGGGGAQWGGNAAAMAAEKQRRAEFEEQTDEYREGGLAYKGARPRKNSI